MRKDAIMKTIEMEMVVNQNGRSIMRVSVPPDLPPGKHRVVLVIEEKVLPLKSQKINASPKTLVVPSKLKEKFTQIWSAELDHLEEEFKDYENKFPYE